MIVGVAVTVRDRLAVCERSPLVPRSVTGEDTGDATADAAKVNPWLAPAATVNGEAGEVVTPDGSPLTSTLTLLAKPS